MLKVTWFDRLNGAVDEAIRFLPEPEMYSRDTYREILDMEPSEGMRIALISEDKVPIAVSGMIRRDRFVWEPVTNWLSPGMGFPASSGRHVDALSALGVEVPVAWWRMGSLPPAGVSITQIDVKPTHRMTNLASREQFWKETDYLRHIKNIRNRTRNIEIRVGETTFAEPIAAGWYSRWAGGSSDSASVKGRALLAKRLEPLGKHLTIALLDEGKLIAGSTNFVHQKMLVAGVSHLEPEYRKLGAGVRMIDVAFEVAEQRGLDGFDLGGVADYKRKWAPECGERAKFTISHSRTRLMRRCLNLAQRVGNQITFSGGTRDTGSLERSAS